MVRSTRFGLSLAVDPYGRTRGWLSHWDGGDRILVASVPRHGVQTVYGALGDWFPLASVVFGLGAVVVALRRRRRGRLAAGEAEAEPGEGHAAASWRTPSSPSRAEASSTPAGASTSTSPRS
jgi:hypothetical protein